MEPNQLVQFSGAVGILGAYTLSQLGKLRIDTLTYSLLNFLGAGLLAYEALRTAQWGFFLLEGSWTVVSAYGLLRWYRVREKSGTETE